MKFAAALAGLAFAACTPSDPAPASVTLSVEDKDEARERHLKVAMEQDTAFAEMAAKDGVAAAFAAYMDAVDGQLIQAAAVIKGEAEIRAAFADWPENAQLLWAPDGGSASADGDLAVTTGRFKRVVDGATVQEGRYVTVWRKNGAGDWKGFIDIGQPDAPLPTPPEDSSAKPPAGGAKKDE